MASGNPLCIAAISISRAPLSVDREKRVKKRVKYGDLFLNLIIKNVFLIKYYIYFYFFKSPYELQ